MPDPTGDRSRSNGTASPAKRIFVLGGTGTIGQATVRALVNRGCRVTCLVRAGWEPASLAALIPGAELRFGDAMDETSIARDGVRGDAFDAVISCLASRTGVPQDAWAVDHAANSAALRVASAAGMGHMVLLSAICVQKPRLAFQEAKLAMERELIASGMPYSIIRPTAFFKSLTGQVARVQRGKPYLVFGDGTLTSCKPISDDDLGRYLAECLDDPSRRNAVLPIGGPGPAITPREQAEHLFAVLGQPPRIRQVPTGLLSGIAGALGLLGRVSPGLAAKAELARIGNYYATESMLVLDPETGRYAADLTPSTGSETLFDFQERLVRGEVSVDRGEHAVFQ